MKNENNYLYVFALESEAKEEFDTKNILYTGVGKINATYQLTRHLQRNIPDIIINLGSAGSNKFKRGTVVCCTKFIQRDMNAASIGCEKYETPFSIEGPILDNGINIPFLEKAICGTGDNFETSHSVTDYEVVDMEAYALALVAKRENIPFLCLKYISDGADNSAADDWETMVHKAAKALRENIDKISESGYNLL